MTAAISGEICTARLLLKHEANGLLCNTTGQTANQIAKQCKNDELANFIERKANQNLSNSGNGQFSKAYSTESFCLEKHRIYHCKGITKKIL